MPSTPDLQTWRVASRSEMTEFLDGMSKRRKNKKGKSRRPRGSYLIVRTHLRPVDVYAYLRARFGTPNGFQNIFRKDDSDNLIHWDYHLRAGDADVHISGTSRTVHVMTTEALSDDQWKELIIALKAEFARAGKAKSSMLRSFEKFVVFQNKYVALSGLCAEHHEAIVDSEPPSIALPVATTSKRALERHYASVRAMGKRATGLYGHCLSLRLLTPVMAEAFINMLILTFCKDSVRDDRETFDKFVRAKIPQRLDLLSQHCDGFDAPIDNRTDAYRDFMRVMNSRNFAIHGNVDPLREQIETVYFEGKRPLFVDGGDNILKVFEHLEQINRPSDIIRDYEAVHGFLHEITTYLTPKHQSFFQQVISDPYPGYEVRKRRVTRILPEHSVTSHFQGMRYDDELNVDWTNA
jgi:hypothetical protein